MIDINNPCGEESNWTASVNPSGGTPATINSVAASKPDIEPPHLLNAFVVDSMHVQLIFDETLGWARLKEHTMLCKIIASF